MSSSPETGTDNPLFRQALQLAAISALLGGGYAAIRQARTPTFPDVVREEIEAGPYAIIDKPRTKKKASMWTLPVLGAAMGGGALGGYSLISHLSKKFRDRQQQKELEQANAEFNQAILEYEKAVKGSKTKIASADVDLQEARAFQKKALSLVDTLVGTPLLGMLAAAALSHSLAKKHFDAGSGDPVVAFQEKRRRLRGARAFPVQLSFAQGFDETGEPIENSKVAAEAAPAAPAVEKPESSSYGVGAVGGSTLALDAPAGQAIGQKHAPTVMQTLSSQVSNLFGKPGGQQQITL